MEYRSVEWRIEGGERVVLVASINRPDGPRYPSGWRGDWAAYQGAVPEDLPRDQAVGQVAGRGWKVPEAIARFFFAGVDLPYRS